MNAIDPVASRDIILCECFARDGLQHETAFLATGHKQQLIERYEIAERGEPHVV